MQELSICTIGPYAFSVGYQPTQKEMGRLQERITSSKTGSITSIQAVYVPADDLTDPSSHHVWPSDATVVLSRDIASLAFTLQLIHSIPPPDN